MVFITTDLINEYFGKAGVRRLTFMTVALIIYAFIILFSWYGHPGRTVLASHRRCLNNVFGQSMWIIVGSVIAFVVSQFVDVGVFWLLRGITGGKHLWLRSTGSTAISQLVDTFVILGIAFYLPGKLTFGEYLSTSAGNYLYNLLIAVGLTPIIYLVHGAIDRFLGSEESHHLIDSAAQASLEKP